MVHLTRHSVSCESSRGFALNQTKCLEILMNRNVAQGGAVDSCSVGLCVPPRGSVPIGHHYQAAEFGVDEAGVPILVPGGPPLLRQGSHTGK